MDCSICLMECSDNNVKLKCGHFFHNQCILNWININNICPYCRTINTIPYISNISSILTSRYSFINNQRKTININGKDVSFVIKNLRNINSYPKACMIKKDYKNEDMFIPLYKIHQDDDYYITGYLRLYLLYGNVEKIECEVEKDLFGNNYLSTNKNLFPAFNQDVYEICFTWCYHVWKSITKNYQQETIKTISSLIFDLFIITIQHYKTGDAIQDFQGPLISSIYSCLYFSDNIVLDVTDINIYTDLNYGLDYLLNLREFQLDYLKNNILVF